MTIAVGAPIPAAAIACVRGSVKSPPSKASGHDREDASHRSGGAIPDGWPQAGPSSRDGSVSHRGPAVRLLLADLAGHEPRRARIRYGPVLCCHVTVTPRLAAVRANPPPEETSTLVPNTT